VNWRIPIIVILLVALSVGTMSWLRQFPAHSGEARAQVEAIEGVVSGLQTSLPSLGPIVEATTRAAAWARQKPVAGKVSIDLEELRETLKQLEKEEEGLTMARASLVGAQAEVKARSATLKPMLSDAVWPDQLKSALRAGRDLLLLLGWPLALALALVYILNSDKAKDRIAALSKSLQKVSLPGGVEFTLWCEDFRQSQSETFRKFRTDVQAEYDKLAERHTIKDTLARILKDTIEPCMREIEKTEPLNYRATIHVRDVLLKDAYYQLVDYQPTGGNRGRAWSVRFGMVGRAWRLESDSWNGEVPGVTENLIQDWGLTRDEAQRPGNQTMLCCILKAGTGVPVGALYMDAKGKHKFGSAEQMKALAGKMQKAAETSGLIASLEAIWEDIRKKAPLVEIYGNGS